MSVTFSEKKYNTTATKLDLEIGDDLAKLCIAEAKCHDILMKRYKVYVGGSDTENYLINSIAVHAMYGMIPVGIVNTTGCSISEGFEDRLYRHIRMYTETGKLWLKTYVESLSDTDYDKLVERNQSTELVSRMASLRYSSYMAIHAMDILMTGYVKKCDRRKFITKAIWDLDDCYLRDMLMELKFSIDTRSTLTNRGIITPDRCKRCEAIRDLTYYKVTKYNSSSSSSSSTAN